MFRTRNLVRCDWQKNINVQFYLLIENYLTELTQCLYQIKKMENCDSNRFSLFSLLAMLKLLGKTFIGDILLRSPGRLIFGIAKPFNFILHFAYSDYTDTSFKVKSLIRMHQPVIQLQANPDNRDIQML